jgi:hypothetical protein
MRQMATMKDRFVGHREGSLLDRMSSCPTKRLGWHQETYRKKDFAQVELTTES